MSEVDSMSDKSSLRSRNSGKSGYSGTPISPSSPFALESPVSPRSQTSAISPASPISALSDKSSAPASATSAGYASSRSQLSQASSRSSAKSRTPPSPSTAGSRQSHGTGSGREDADSNGNNGKEVRFGDVEIKDMSSVDEPLSSTSTSRSISSNVTETISPNGSGEPSPTSSPVSPMSPMATSGIRTQGQQMLRLVSLYVFPVLLALPLGLLIHLTSVLLTPLYNSTPLHLHATPLYGFFALGSALPFALITASKSAQHAISARVCLTVMAIAGDLVAVMGRRVGSLSGYIAGPVWGALLARAILGIGAMGGANAFALLCFDFAIPIQPADSQAGKLSNAAQVLARTTAYTFHVYYAEKVSAFLLRDSTSFLVAHPEKTILFVSLLLTALSLFVRTPKAVDLSFADSAHAFLASKLALDPVSSNKLKQATGFLPRTISPFLLLLRLPILVLAVRQQIFLRPSPPYYAANGTLRVLHSEKSSSGQIVVAENLATGYRFLRCDASLLGGRWMRIRENGTAIDLGDSIFATFALQEVVVLAARSRDDDSLARTISMTTELQLTNEVDDEEYEKPPERTLVIGLGVGISAAAMAKRGFAVDLVEIDPVVYKTAVDYFNLTIPAETSSVSLVPAQHYISQMAEIDRASNGTLQKWSYVIHDCFSAGQLPVEVYTAEFWEQVKELVEVDGIVAVNIAGVLGSLAIRRILVTLLTVFEQCRAFGELGNEKESEGLANMVLFCTMTHSPLLSFRPPTRFDVLRSPLRTHTFTTFQQKEIHLDEMVTEAELQDPSMLITSNGSMEGLDQVDTSLATWRAMQLLLSREMWLAW